MAKVLLVDGGLVIYAAATMLSGGEPILMATPQMEIRRRFAKLVLGAKAVSGSTHVAFAMDRGPYRRTKWYAQWYQKYAEISTLVDQNPLGEGADSQKDAVFLHIDNKVFPLFKAFGAWSKRKKPLTIAEKKKVGELEPKPITEEYFECLPKYKQGRDKSDMMSRLGITVDEFHQALETSVTSLSMYLGASIMEVPGWEADDIVGVYCRKAPPAVEEINLMSRDSDWKQLVLLPRVRLWDTFKAKFWTKADRLDITIDLRAKLIGGDTSDAISGVPKGKSGCYGSTSAKKIASAVIPDEIKKLKEMKRNWELVRLPTPSWNVDDKYEDLKAGIKRFKADGNPAAICLSDVDIQEIAKESKVKAFIQRLTGDKPVAKTGE